MKKIQSLANAIYKKHNTTNPFEIAKNLDYTVIKMDMPLALKGYTTKHNRIRFIYINTLHDDNTQRFTCLHELAHIFLKHDDNIIFNACHTQFTNSKEENAANLFATLITLKDYDLDDYKHLTTQQIACLVGIDEKYMNTALTVINS